MAIYLCLCDEYDDYRCVEVHCLTSVPKKGNRNHWGADRKRNLIRAKEEFLKRWTLSPFNKFNRPYGNVNFFIDVERLCEFGDALLAATAKSRHELGLTEICDTVMIERGGKPIHGVIVSDID